MEVMKVLSSFFSILAKKIIRLELVSKAKMVKLNIQ